MKIQKKNKNSKEFKIINKNNLSRKHETIKKNILKKDVIRFNNASKNINKKKILDPSKINNELNQKISLKSYEFQSVFRAMKEKFNSDHLNLNLKSELFTKSGDDFFRNKDILFQNIDNQIK